MEGNQVELARLMRERHRYDEAEASLLQHLAQFPDDPEAYCELALTRMQMEGRDRDSLEAIEKAIGIVPENAWMLAVKAWILSSMSRHDKAIAATDEAIRLDPQCTLAWIARGRALGGREQWKSAEEAVRQALKIDPDDSEANNLLSLYLRLQGRTEEADYYTATMLSRNAEDDVALTNAGWTRLHEGRHREAEQLFMDALRIAPDSEYARSGIREAYKARSAFYRLYLRWVFFMQRFRGPTQFIIIIGLFFGFKFLFRQAANINPSLGIGLVFLYTLLIFWVWLASGLGHFIILLDRRARQSLNRPEKWDGILVGGFFFVGLMLLAGGLATATVPLTIFGAGLITAAVPNSLVCLNESRAGQIIFGLTGIGCMLSACLGVAVSLSGNDPTAAYAFLGMNLVAAMLTTWAGNLSFLRG